MADAAAQSHGRINAGPVLAEAGGNLRRHARLLPRLAWPALLAALAVELVRQLAVPADSGWQAVTLVKLPFDLMLATAWTRLLLLGRAAARVPALGWGRAETDFLFALVVFALAFFGGVVLTVLIVGNLPLPERTLTLVVAAAICRAGPGRRGWATCRTRPGSGWRSWRWRSRSRRCRRRSRTAPVRS